MAIPTQTEIEVPLLRALIELGGQARPREVYPLLEKQLGLSDADLAEQRLRGGSKWRNRVQWARQSLVSLGEIEQADWGIWRVTDNLQDIVRRNIVAHAEARTRAVNKDLFPGA